jgi:cytochrome b
MKRVLIWDLPVRVLHLVFAASTTAALCLGLGLEEEHPWFGYHAWAAMLAAGALVLRVFWGFVGSRHARFTAWSWRPSAFVSFLAAEVGLAPRAHPVSHNPAASWVMLGMLALVGALVGTGLAGGEDPHEGLAIALLVLIGLHLAGLVWHGFRHRENIALSMADGRKLAPEAEALPDASGKSGAAIMLVLAVWVVLLARGYDHAAGTLKLPLLKHPLVLTEGAGEESDDEGGVGEQE